MAALGSYFPGQVFNAQNSIVMYATEQVLNQGTLTERGRISTIDLLVLTSLDQLLFILKIFFLVYKTS
jgi:hypothetical protein